MNVFFLVTFRCHAAAAPDDTVTPILKQLLLFFFICGFVFAGCIA